MARFYFTYGTEGQPFYGGWSVVEAPDRSMADAAFRAYHSDKMKGNFGARCHEIIRLSREVLTMEGDAHADKD